MAEDDLYFEISVPVLHSDVDAVSNYIIENIASGILLEDEDDNLQTIIKFYPSNGIDINSKLEWLRKYLRAINPEYEKIETSRKSIKSLDWIESYRASVTPIFAGNSIVIIPPWDDEDYQDKTTIIIEPKMAFGTGRHETTRSCLAVMEKIDFNHKVVLDLGCGSGILGVYAAKKGASKVQGYDIDTLAVDNSLENFEINHVCDKCKAELGSIENITDEKYDVGIVNIIKAVILPIMPRLKEIICLGGYLILSGLLINDRTAIENALSEHNLVDCEIHLDGEWITYKIQM
ncbi:MAG: 50S ribosomal protein L11 methyltransferase [candidate division Zixibacteria bacterium]